MSSEKCTSRSYLSRSLISDNASSYMLRSVMNYFNLSWSTDATRRDKLKQEMQLRTVVKLKTWWLRACRTKLKNQNARLTYRKVLLLTWMRKWVKSKITYANVNKKLTKWSELLSRKSIKASNYSKKLIDSAQETVKCSRCLVTNTCSWRTWLHPKQTRKGKVG